MLAYAPNPCAVITLSGPLYAEATGALGDPRILQAAVGNPPVEKPKMILKAGFGNVGLLFAPPTNHPDMAAVPLKSNTLCYGPWAAVGAPGKVKFDQDTSLAPWNYGGYEFMDEAGNSRVKDAVTNMQVSESGMVEKAGAPSASLGDVLQSGGPNVTNIDVQVGTQGVTTSYRFQTYTAKFGVFSKGNAERFKHAGIVAQNFRRAIRAGAKQSLAKGEVRGNAGRAQAAFMGNAPNAMKRQSPQDMLIANVFESENGDVRVGVSATTMEESVYLATSNDDEACQAFAAMSFTGLVRPFSKATVPNMSSYPDSSPTGVPCRKTLDPWKAVNDIECFTWGATQGSSRFDVGDRR